MGIAKTSKIPENLDDLIIREKRALIKEYFDDVWVEMKSEGMETQLIVEVFMESAIDHLANEIGNEEASKLISHLKNLEEMGFSPTNRTLQ